MKIAIIGNGPSRSLYDEKDNFDKVIGCNLPPENIKIDYVSCVDAKAVGLSYRPTEDTFYHRLRDEGFKLILGNRARHGLGQSKCKPGDVKTTYEYLKENGHVYKVYELFSDAKSIGQRYFSAGHQAFIFANDEWPESEIHMFGFDSFFTGNQSTHSVIIHNRMFSDTIPRFKKKASIKEPVATVGSWYWLWEKVWNSDKNTATSINIHGYVGDDIPNSFKDKVNIIYHEILPS